MSSAATSRTGASTTPISKASAPAQERCESPGIQKLLVYDSVGWNLEDRCGDLAIVLVWESDHAVIVHLDVVVPHYRQVPKRVVCVEPPPRSAVVGRPDGKRLRVRAIGL